MGEPKAHVAIFRFSSLAEVPASLLAFQSRLRSRFQWLEVLTALQLHIRRG